MAYIAHADSKILTSSHIQHVIESGDGCNARDEKQLIPNGISVLEEFMTEKSKTGRVTMVAI
jgi:hypothetical protein